MKYQKLHASKVVTGRLPFPNGNWSSCQHRGKSPSSLYSWVKPFSFIEIVQFITSPFLNIRLLFIFIEKRNPSVCASLVLWSF